MRSSIPAVILAVLLCGCSQKSDPRLTALEARVRELETRLAEHGETEAGVTELLKRHLDVLEGHTKQIHWLTRSLTSQSDFTFLLDDKLTAHINQHTNRTIRSTPPR